MRETADPSVPDDGLALTRTQRKRVQKTNEILAAAAEVLADRGYAATSLDEIAERLDLVKATLYHYFDSKDALVAACLQASADSVIERLERIAGGSGTPTQRLHDLVVEQLRLTTVEMPKIARLFIQVGPWPEEQRRLLRTLRERHTKPFALVVEEGMATGEFEVDDLGTALHCLHGALNYALVWLRPANEKQRLLAANRVADQVLRLFLARSQG